MAFIHHVGHNKGRHYVVRHFHSIEKFDKSPNESFITLIPESHGKLDIKDL